MRRFHVKAVSPTDRVVFLNWKTDAPDSQAAIRQFFFMLEDCIGPEYHLNGDFNIEVREIAQKPKQPLSFPRPA